MEVFPGPLVGQSLDAAALAVLDELGRQSGIAQQLKGPITSVEKLSSAPVEERQVLIIFRDSTTDEKSLLGYIKFGEKDLFLYLKSGTMLQVRPLCLLDFYVSEALQRQGLGLQLFQRMLQECNIAPNKIAYDRPSPKLLTFVKKHFALSKPDLQPNRFCVFEGFFDT